MNVELSTWHVETNKQVRGPGFCQPVHESGARGPEFHFLNPSLLGWALAAAENWIQTDPDLRLKYGKYHVTEDATICRPASPALEKRESLGDEDHASGI